MIAVNWSAVALLVSTSACILLGDPTSNSATAFVAPQPVHPFTKTRHNHNTVVVRASTEQEEEVEIKSERQTLGLLTFDLDDTLYPIAIVEEEANRAFVEAMAEYGYGDGEIQPSDIVAAAQQIRDEISATEGPQAAAALTHGELRRAAIRREMERWTVKRKLKACAEEWATTVDALSPVVLENTKK
jgi:hypothetical protein